ncbi:MAG: Jag N-terminal domain-containing protein [Actinobacteria bacterium]|nr:Jag N-terminal domain-containing protein [Actinomycetota bacterium]
MEWVEITAKTVDAAKERALDELGISADEAEFVVLEEPRRGLFNQIRGTARVRARVAPRAPRAKNDRRGRRGPRSETSDGAADPGAGGSRKSDARAPRAKKTSPAPEASGDDGAAGNDTGARPSRSSSGRSRQRKRPGTQTSSSETTKQEGTTMSMTLDEQVQATEAFLDGLLHAIGFEGTITSDRIDDANAQVNIEGEGLGLLIGPRGQTMNAIQDMTRVVLQKQAAGSWEGHVHVDVNGYRAKRRAALVTFVEGLAAEVAETGAAKALEPMSSSDRKVVHDTVNGIDGVHTTSEGHEPRRWVKIIPGSA